MSGILLLVDGLEKSKYFRKEMFLERELFLHKTSFQLFQSESKKNSDFIFNKMYFKSSMVQHLAYSEECYAFYTYILTNYRGDP